MNIRFVEIILQNCPTQYFKILIDYVHLVLRTLFRFILLLITNLNYSKFMTYENLEIYF